ncbi:MAG: LysM peptidoglycan-binding domain-containing protein, partial [Chloroflexi bacterium]|nr:LysM peptidoglycan-binding domain-containing protein [Chloroflexota bacterium]
MTISTARAVTYHQVAAGETWESIAAQYTVPLETLWEANGITNPSLLQAEQNLFIPGPGGSVQETVTVSGPSLHWMALRSGNTSIAVMLLNGFSTPAQATVTDAIAPDNRNGVP